MANITFDCTLDKQGSFTIPRVVLEQLNIEIGDPMRLRVEITKKVNIDASPNQTELQCRASQLFARSDQSVREPMIPFTDSHESDWAKGIEEKARKMGLQI